MKIGIDLRPLQGHNKYRGIGRNIYNLIREISFIDNKNTYIFYAFEGKEEPIDYSALNKNFKYQIRKVKFANLSHTKYIGIFFDEFMPVDVLGDGLDIFFQTDMQYGLPRNVKTVAIFYDLIPYYYWNKDKLKNYKGFRKAKIVAADKIIRRRYLSVLSRYKKADMIISISESSKRDLLNHFKSINENRVKVALLGFGGAGHKYSLSSSGINNIPQDYLLYVGGVDLRKNILGLAKMFFDIKKDIKYKNLKLVMAGKEFNNKAELIDLGWYELVKNNKYKKDIIFTGYVDDKELNYLYNNTKVFVFPSLYEGFGLPVLEAMNMGAPVVAFNNSSIPEVAGDAAILCESEVEFEAGIKKLLDDKKFRKSLIDKGYRQVKKFSWEKTAKETIKAIEDLGKEKG
jgi:glycosyltransferase involved in cell wall biosynthesis